jgi:hypothetical protein
MTCLGLGLADRRSVFAVLFTLAAVRDPIALTGIAILLVACVVTGRFTVLLKHAVHKEEADHPE